MTQTLKFLKLRRSSQHRLSCALIPEVSFGFMTQKTYEGKKKSPAENRYSGIIVHFVKII